MPLTFYAEKPIFLLEILRGPSAWFCLSHPGVYASGGCFKSRTQAGLEPTWVLLFWGRLVANEDVKP